MKMNPELPTLYAQENERDPIVYQIITCLNSFWLLTEYNPDTKIAFGFCQLLPDCGELGYVSIDEIDSLPYPVESYIVKRPLSELKKIYVGE